MNAPDTGVDAGHAADGWVGRDPPDQAARQLAKEQAALRRVATLVARGEPPEAVFTAVLEEVGRLLPVDLANMCRYEPDRTVTFVATWGTAGERFPVGSRWPLEGYSLVALVFETGRPVRLDRDDDSSSGSLGAAALGAGIRSAVGAPIIVAGNLWGAILAGSTLEQPLPPDTETRLASFTELVATAIANAESRAALARLAEEQAALRRVATLVARGAVADELFVAVTGEVGRLLGGHLAGMGRYDSDDTVTMLATWGAEGEEHPLVPGPWPLEGDDLASIVFRTGQSVRIDDYRSAPGPIAAFVREELGVGASVASPIVVEGRLWGVLFLHAKQTRGPFPRDAESRLTGFTELVATAIANADSRAALARLAEEQAALRRVAVLVARATSPQEVFAAVAGEVGGLLAVDYTVLIRSDPQDMITVVGGWTATGVGLPSPAGSRFEVGGRNVSTLTLRTGRPARLDAYVDVTGSIGNTGAHGWGFRSSVGVPISVEGRPWGLILVAYTRDQQLPADTETRLASFTELVATAIANADSRAELLASRARIVAAADDARRRIERDLHDGTQQQLVTLILDLREVQAEVPPELEGSLSRIAEQVTAVLDQVREISRGIHPVILSEGGLTLALRALGRRSAVPVELDLRTGRRLPDPVEVAAYYAVSEALANTVKHARASAVHVELDTPDTAVRLAIRDDGIGGADPARGSGLTGLRDRVEAVGGTFNVTSPAGGGTTLLIEIPV